ncbi:MAG: type II secretion system ATPase GspE [Deltaproteobacteria bacterium]|nr:type II secretion system ATPase GspE [Deltaproteobacteria bacterium]
MGVGREKLGEILLQRGLVVQEDLVHARASALESGNPLWRQLILLGAVDEDEMIQIMSELLEVESLTAEQYPSAPVQVNSLSLKFMRQARFIPVDQRDEALVVAMADPEDFYTIEAIEQACRLRVQRCIGRQRDIEEAIERLYGSGASTMERIVGDLGMGEVDAVVDPEDVEHLRDMASEAPVIRLVNLIITRALETHASDIHIEPFENSLKVRYRIDGVLYEVESPPRRLQPAITSRIKIMAKMNIAERRLPQDGRIKLRISGRDIDFRISTIPTMCGESVVMRILDRESVILDIRSLGFPEDTLSVFRDLIARPYGMILVTGPTGSGKTTTLYSALQEINTPDKKIITIEDPVEYQLPGINQIQVKPQIGLSFAHGLRSIVRQDPDIILVGEIRDHETAEIAIHAGLTGHVVFSTLHTNDSAGAVTRMLEMEMEDYLLASCLMGVLAQRLVRVICPQCKAEYEPDILMLEQLGLPPEAFRDWKFYKGKGCEQCYDTGFRGRTGIYEFLEVDDEIRKLITNRSDAGIIRDAAIRKGMRTLREDGWEKVRKGITTISELMRVTLDQ